MLNAMPENAILTAPRWSVMLVKPANECIQGHPKVHANVFRLIFLRCFVTVLYRLLHVWAKEVFCWPEMPDPTFEHRRKQGNGDCEFAPAIRCEALRQGRAERFKFGYGEKMPLKPIKVRIDLFVPLQHVGISFRR